MNICKSVLVIIFVGMLWLYFPLIAQGGHHHGGHFHPDSLTMVTVSGSAIVDSSMTHPIYFLDEDSNGQADYHLNFGPYWYQPDSGNASRPQHGETITIEGGTPDTVFGNIPMIVVYQINGEFWRDPLSPYWTHMGTHMHGGGHHQGNCTGHAFGWMHDSLQMDTLSGTALVDTTFVFEHYYLDEDGSGSPDYFLNFGPPWYEPTSGATRPQSGDQIDIIGGVLNRTNMPMVVVFSINGLLWRDSTHIGPHFGAGWIQRNMSVPRQIHAPFDSSDWLQMNPGWHQGGGHHHGMPDSLFGQMLQLFPQNIPNTGNQNVFAGYEFGFFFPDSSNGMWQNGGCGGHMNFGSTSQFKMHYNDVQIQGMNIDESSVSAKYWDSHSNSWIEVTNAILDPVNNTVSFSSSRVSNFVILTGDEITGIDSAAPQVSQKFTLKQNYPNPFNPSTTIEFELKQSEHVVLSIYNALGQKLYDVVDRSLTAGVHRVNFNARSLSSGIYFYKLQVGQQSQVKKMELLK